MPKCIRVLLKKISLNLDFTTIRLISLNILHVKLIHTKSIRIPPDTICHTFLRVHILQNGMRFVAKFSFISILLRRRQSKNKIFVIKPKPVKLFHEILIPRSVAVVLYSALLWDWKPALKENFFRIMINGWSLRKSKNIIVKNIFWHILI